MSDLSTCFKRVGYALLEWPENISISDTSPAEYVPLVRQRFSEQEWEHMCAVHALPQDWETLAYEDFLQQRRVLMAAIIRRGYETLR